LTEDHLDRHADLDAYRAAKLRIFENQQPDDVAVVPRGFEGLPGHGRRVEFDLGDDLPAEPLILGAHNRENAAAATAAARAAGISDESIAEALRTFEGVPHRLELVGEAGGVRFVNDSKATNPEAAERALSAYPPGVRLILGGSRKGSSFASLARTAREAAVAQAYLIGESADDLAEALAAQGVRFTNSGTLDRAVRDAFTDAERGEVVLLSPACASYDQFRDFEERGERFRELVEAL
jgi:UDP-N-acetylmuramoylalanine--D-glutamate ligase